MSLMVMALNFPPVDRFFRLPLPLASRLKVVKVYDAFKWHLHFRIKLQCLINSTCKRHFN